MRHRGCWVALALLSLGLGGWGQVLGGIAQDWPGGYYLRLTYVIKTVRELGVAPPRETDEWTLTVEFIPRGEGGHRVRIEAEGIALENPGLFTLNLVWMPTMSLTYLGTMKSLGPSELWEPLKPGRTYEIPFVSPPSAAEMGFTFPFGSSKLVIGEKEVSVAGVKAVEATLTEEFILPDGTTETSVTTYVLPLDPPLPYPVRVEISMGEVRALIIELIHWEMWPRG